MSDDQNTERIITLTREVAILTSRMESLTDQAANLVAELQKLRDERNKVAGIMVALVTGLGLAGGALGGKLASILGWFHSTGIK